jgi:hypothetical protein
MRPSKRGAGRSVSIRSVSITLLNSRGDILTVAECAGFLKTMGSIMSSRLLSLHGRCAVVECATCRCDHTLEAGEEAPMLKQHVCNWEGCTVPLCDSCPQFQCEACDGVFCPEHRSAVGCMCRECAEVLALEAMVPDDPLPACAVCGVVRKVVQSEINAGRVKVCCGEVA